MIKAIIARCNAYNEKVVPLNMYNGRKIGRTVNCFYSSKPICQRRSAFCIKYIFSLFKYCTKKLWPLGKRQKQFFELTVIKGK